MRSARAPDPLNEMDSMSPGENTFDRADVSSPIPMSVTSALRFLHWMLWVSAKVILDTFPPETSTR